MEFSVLPFETIDFAIVFFQPITKLAVAYARNLPAPV